MQRIPTLIRANLAALTLITLAACSAGGSATPEPPTPATIPSAGSPSSAVSPSSAASPSGAESVDAISIKGFAFAPETLSVPVGTTVTWTNDEDSLHTVTSGTPERPSSLFDSGEIDTGVEFPYTFEEPGSYPFFCARHDFMTGEITVTP